MGTVQVVMTMAQVRRTIPEKPSRRLAGITIGYGIFPILAYLAAMMCVPTALLVLYSFLTPGFFSVDYSLTFSNYLNVAAESIYWQLLLKSLTIGFTIAATMTMAAFAMAYAMTFKFGKWGPRILVLVVATLLSSYVVRIYAWATILGTNGILNSTLINLGIINKPMEFLLYGYFAIFVTLFYVYLPVVVLPIYAGLQDIDPRLVEASRDMGAPPLETFWKVIWPLALPATRIAFMFAFVLTSSDYITPSLVGGIKGQMIGNVISDQFGGASNYPQGAALAVTLVLAFVIGVAMLSLLGRLMRRVRSIVRRTVWNVSASRARVGLLHRIPNTGTPFAVLTTILMLLFLAVPLVTVIVFSFNSTTNPGLPLEHLTLHWYGSVLGSDQFHRALTTSAEVAFGAVGIALLLGVPAALAMTRGRVRAGGAVQMLVYGPMAIPGIVIGVALLTTFVYLNVTLGVAATVAAHALLVVPYIIFVLRNRLRTISVDIEAAARDLGANPLRVLRTIILPLIMPALVGASLLGLAISFDELVVTNFTIGNAATLPVWVLSQIHLKLTPAINAIAVLMLMGTLLLLAGSAGLSRLRRSSQKSLADTLRTDVLVEVI